MPFGRRVRHSDVVLVLLSYQLALLAPALGDYVSFFHFTLYKALYIDSSVISSFIWSGRLRIVGATPLTG